jgi:hypothetical protein
LEDAGFILRAQVICFPSYFFLFSSLFEDLHVQFTYSSKEAVQILGLRMVYRRSSLEVGARVFIGKRVPFFVVKLRDHGRYRGAEGREHAPNRVDEVVLRL